MELPCSFELLFEAAPDAYLVLAPDAPRFTILAVTDAYLQATAASREALLGRGCFEALPLAIDEYEFRRSLEQVLSTGAPHEMAVQRYGLPRPGGGAEERCWSRRNHPVRDREGRLIAIVHRLEDATSLVQLETVRKEAVVEADRAQRCVDRELALRESERRYRAIFDQSMDAMLLTAPDGRVFMVNAAGVEMFGYSEGELRELGRQAVVAPEDPRLAAALEIRRRTGRFRGELTMKRKDGTRFPVELSSAIFRDETGAEWTSMFVRDIGDRVAQRAERDRLAAEVDARRRWLEAVLEHAPIGIMLFEPDGRLYSNRRTEEMLGRRLPPGEGSAPYAHRVFHPDGSPVPRDRFLSSRVLRTGETILGAEFLVERQDGSRIPILGSAAPIRDAAGRITGAVGLVQDVSDRMRAQEALRTRERLLSSIFEIVPVGLWVADREGRPVRANPAALRIWGGWPPVGAAFEAWWADSGERVAPRARPLADALGGEKSIGKTMRILALDGAVRTIVNAALPLYDERGRLSGAVVVNQDITGLMEAEDALRRAVRSRDDVLGVVAHDLRNPLHGITLEADALRRSSSPERTLKGAASIKRLAERMNHLIEDLLDVARIESGTLAIEREPVAVEALLDEVLESQESIAAKASLDLRREVRGRLGQVYGDRRRLLQVFENLIGNAAKFTPAGGVITVGAASGREETVFWVADSGHGIPADSIPHLFDRFWQADRRDTRGAGLGLAIVKGIVEAHRGRIWVRSELGVGTTFSFTLPDVPPAETEASTLH